MVRKLSVPSQGRLYYIRYAFRMGWPLERVADRRVLDLVQIRVVALSCSEQLGRAQEAPDMVGAERRRVAQCHQIG